MLPRDPWQEHGNWQVKDPSDQLHLFDGECPLAGDQITDGSFRDAGGTNQVSLAHLMFNQQLFQQFV